MFQAFAEVLPQVSPIAALEAREVEGGIAFAAEALIELHHSSLQFAVAFDKLGAGFHQIAEAVHQLRTIGMGKAAATEQLAAAGFAALIGQGWIGAQQRHLQGF